MSERWRYSVVIQWSDDNAAYLVTLPEWEGRVFNPVTHGDTHEQAVARADDVLTALISSARQRGEALPEPRVFASSATS